MTDPNPFPLQSMLTHAGAALYLTGEDALLVTVFNAASGVTVKVSGRTLPLTGGRPSPFRQTLVPATDRSASTTLVPLDDGWLLNAQVIVSGGAPLIGQTFCRLSLVRGLTSVAEELFTLAAGYVTAKQSISYPGSSIASSLDGDGALRSITGTTPAAGAEISETVPVGVRWEIRAFRALLTTSVAVANRVTQFVLDDGTLEYFRGGSSGQQAASIAGQHSASQGWGLVSFDGVANWAHALPVGIRMGAGHRIRTLTNNIQAADQYSLVQYLVHERLEGA